MKISKQSYFGIDALYGQVSEYLLIYFVTLPICKFHALFNNNRPRIASNFPSKSLVNFPTCCAKIAYPFTSE